MNETASLGAQKRIDYYGRWAWAFFAVFVVMAGWLGGRYEAEAFGIMFQLGVVCAVVVAVLCLGFAWTTHQRIKQLEEYKDE